MTQASPAHEEDGRGTDAAGSPRSAAAYQRPSVQSAVAKASVLQAAERDVLGEEREGGGADKTDEITLEDLCTLHEHAVASNGGGCFALGAMQWAVEADPEAMRYAHRHLAHDGFFNFGKGKGASVPTSYKVVSSILADTPKRLLPSRPGSARVGVCSRPVSARNAEKAKASLVPAAIAAALGVPPAPAAEAFTPLRGEAADVQQRMNESRLMFLSQSARDFATYNSRRVVTYGVPG